MPPMATSNATDVISRLLRSEQAGIFQYLSQVDPHIGRTAAQVRRPLLEMMATSLRHQGELTFLLQEYGLTPPPPQLNPEFQNFAYLSLDYLLPRLAAAKRQSIADYEAALREIAADDPSLANVLQSHLATHQHDLAVLEKAVTPAAQPHASRLS